VGDASGKSAQRAAAGKSDFDIIHARLKEENIPYVDKTPEANPAVKDRVNTVNARLRSASGEVNLTLNPTGCPKLKKDFERVQWKEGAQGAFLDKVKDLELTHSSDGVGYALSVLTPIKPLKDIGKLRVGGRVI
jgi:hypothetical protein